MPFLTHTIHSIYNSEAIGIVRQELAAPNTTQRSRAKLPEALHLVLPIPPKKAAFILVGRVENDIATIEAQGTGPFEIGRSWLLG